METDAVLLRKTNARVATFLFHDVTDDPTVTGFQRKSALAYKHGTAEFENSLNQIALSSLRPMRVDQIDFESQTRSLMLTFDDGGKSALYIADRLEKRGWRGHFFITTSLINSRTFLSRWEIRDLHNRGHIVGSHSHTHPEVFCHLEPSRMQLEWRTSMDILSDIISNEVTSASIPCGHIDANTQLSALKSGIHYLFTSEPTLVPWKFYTMLCLGRVYPKRGASLRRVRNLARHRGYGYEMFIRKMKSIPKKLLYGV